LGPLFVRDAPIICLYFKHLASAGTGQNGETLFTTCATGARGQRHRRQGHKSSTGKALANYQLANNQRLTIGLLPINTESYKHLTFLPSEIEKVVDCDSCIMNYSETCFGRPPIH